MMTPKRRRQTGPLVLVVIGVSIMLIGIGLHWWYEAHGQKHTLEWIPQFIGAAIAFAGFYGMDPTRAKDGGAFLLDAGTRIVAVIRPGGRRATDPPVVTPTATTAEMPVADELELPPPPRGD